MNRRGFLQLGRNALASSGLLATLGGFERALAAMPRKSIDTGGYKALVCVFMYGGNDSFNLLVPRSFDAYGQYSASRQNLSVPLLLLQLQPLYPQNYDGNDYAVHPSAWPIQQLFNAGKLSFVANVGSLVEPVTREQYRTGTARLPLQLFSHEDQQVQWMTSRADSVDRIGWAGRIADLLAAQGTSSKLAVNISIGSANIWQSGGDTLPYVLGAGGAPELEVLEDGGDARAMKRREAFLQILQQTGADASLMAQEFAATQNRAIDLGKFINEALASVPDFGTKFPNDFLGLGPQLKMVARTIRARAALGVSRQMFFVNMGRFDTHDGQLQDHPGLLSILAQGLSAFSSAIEEIGAQNLVTTFTASDFGRTLTSNGNGTDHGWGGHQMVMGGAVKGRTIFGRMPNLALDGPDDAEVGRIIPTQSTDQFSATLARWFGVGESDLDLVFPNLGNFASRDLGFMS
jgi:uncharacterized protein (DUF1501 family)